MLGIRKGIAGAVRGALKSPTVKRTLHHVGAFRAYHRARNRRVLTVLMFHQVLPERDPRFATCDPEYTCPERLFEDVLGFVSELYTPISLDQLRTSKPDLPDYPLLVTLDDGWADNEDCALPHLKNARVPAVVFVASDGVGLRDPLPFWETRMVQAFRAGRLGPDACRALWTTVGGEAGEAPRFETVADLRQLIARLDALEPARVPDLLAPFETQLAAPAGAQRQLLSREQLRNLARNGVAIGGHGQTHRGLARVPRFADELHASRQALAEAMGEPPDSMSFPHGEYDERVVKAAQEAGYRFIFTSDPVLNPVPKAGELPPVLGRIGIEAATIVDEAGRFRPELLALWLFRRPRVALDGRRRVHALARPEPAAPEAARAA